MARSELDIILKLTDKASSGLGKFTKGITAVAVAMGAAKVAGEAWQAAIAGSQMLKAEAAFASMAKSVGQDIHAIARSMIEASGGALDMQTAMQSASQAIKLGVAETPEEFAKLTRAAVNLGAAMGRGPVEAIDDIVRGIGRMSPLILDNIGIMTSGGQIFEDYAISIGKSADQLTDAEKKQSLFNAAVRDGAKLSDAQSTGFEQMDAALKDLADVISKTLAPAIEPIAKALGEWAREKVGVIDATQRLTEAGYDLGAMYDSYLLQTNDAWEADRLLKEEKERLLGVLDAEMGRWTAMGEFYAPTVAGLDEISAATGGLAGNTERAVAAMGNFAASAMDAAFQAAFWRDATADGIVTDAELDRFQDMSDALGIDVPEDIQTAITNFNQFAQDGIDPATASADELFASLAKTLALDGSIVRIYIKEERYRGSLGGGGEEESAPGVQQQHGGSFTVPPGYPNDSYRMGVSSGERVSVSNDSRSFFGGSNVNINNGTSMDVFEEMLRNIQ